MTVTWKVELRNLTKSFRGGLIQQFLVLLVNKNTNKFVPFEPSKCFPYDALCYGCPLLHFSMFALLSYKVRGAPGPKR